MSVYMYKMLLISNAYIHESFPFLDVYLVSGHRDAGAGVVGIGFFPQGNNGLGLSVKVETALAVEVHVTENGSTATSLYKT